MTNHSTKNTCRHKISIRLLGLYLKSDNMRKSKAIKYIVKKYCLILSKVV